MPFGNSIARLIVPGTRLARRTDLAWTHGVVSQSRQRLECGDLSPLFSASASQLAADPPVPRAKAPTSWRTPNAAASAKPALSVLTCRVRNALNTYVPEGQTAIAQRFIAGFGRASDMSPGGTKERLIPASVVNRGHSAQSKRRRRCALPAHSKGPACHLSCGLLCKRGDHLKRKKKAARTVRLLQIVDDRASN